MVYGIQYMAYQQGSYIPWLLESPCLGPYSGSVLHPQTKGKKATRMNHPTSMLQLSEAYRRPRTQDPCTHVVFGPNAGTGFTAPRFWCAARTPRERCCCQGSKDFLKKALYIEPKEAKMYTHGFTNHLLVCFCGYLSSCFHIYIYIWICA